MTKKEVDVDIGHWDLRIFAAAKFDLFFNSQETINASGVNVREYGPQRQGSHRQIPYQTTLSRNSPTHLPTREVNPRRCAFYLT